MVININYNRDNNSMKAFKILTFVSLPFIAVSCKQTLFEDIDMAGVNVVESENVKYDGKIITVKKGEPVNFDLVGSPDFITFYSGELGSQYIYRETVDGKIDDIQSVKLKFNVWAQYGLNKDTEENSTRGQMEIFYATENADGTPVFPGLSRNFEQDSVLIESMYGTAWQELIPVGDMPNVPGDVYNKYTEENTTKYSSRDFEIDLTRYKDKKFTMAFAFNRIGKQGVPNSSNPNETILQSTWHFEDMHLETTWKNGRVTKQYADAFGLTPVNMKNKTVFEDHKDNEFQMPDDKEYGAVKANVEGFWNFSNLLTGKIDISGCAANGVWKYSWMVSDYINFASKGEADQAVRIKDINLPVDSYQYVYNTVGTYRATFVMSNENFDDAQQKIVEFIIDVVDSL